LVPELNHIVICSRLKLHKRGQNWLLAVPDTWHHQHRNVRYKYMIGARELILLWCHAECCVGIGEK